MRKLSKEWSGGGSSRSFCQLHTLFGGNIMSLFQKNLINQNSTASVANSQSINNNGVIINDVVVGQGAKKLRNGQSVSVHYILSLSGDTCYSKFKKILVSHFKFTRGRSSYTGWRTVLPV